MSNIYLTDAYLNQIDTVVENIRTMKKEIAVSLAENIFYPGGGGQPPDKGIVRFRDSSAIPILRILKERDEVFISLSKGREISIAEPVHAEIDWNRRYSYMRCHTATHVLMGVLKREIERYNPAGINIAETGDIATAKFEGAWDKSEGKVNHFINKANEIIATDLKVIIKTYQDISEAIQENQEIYRGPKEFSGEVRIVIIDGWDANPCGGTHINHLKEIGHIKPVNFIDNEITFSLEKTLI